MLHGSIYLVMKTENRLYAKLTVLVNNCSKFFILCFILASMSTLIYIPHMTDEFKQNPWLFGLPLLAVLTVLNIKRNIDSRKYFTAFVFSSCITAILLILFAIGLYPNIVISTTNPAYSIRHLRGRIISQIVEDHAFDGRDRHAAGNFLHYIRFLDLQG